MLARWAFLFVWHGICEISLRRYIMTLINKCRLVQKFWSVAGGHPFTQNVPLKRGNLTVTVREMNNLEKQALINQGHKIDLNRPVRCLYVEGKIAFGKGSIKKEYFVQYINYEDGTIEWHAAPRFWSKDVKHDGERCVCGDNYCTWTKNLTRLQFQDFLRKSILPLFRERKKNKG